MIRASKENLALIINKFGSNYKDGTVNHITYNCPFCEVKRSKVDKAHKLYVNYVKLKFFCFKCGSRGSIAKLDSSYGVYDELLDYDKSFDETDIDDDNMFYLPNVSIRKDTIAYDYLESRNITDDMIDYYNIRLGVGDMFGRVVIPNEIYSKIWTDMYSGRAYIDIEPKYRNPDNAKKTDSVFNLHNISESIERLFIVEGAITSIHAGKDSVAIYGAYPSNLQVNKIVSKNAKEYYVVLDNDEAGCRGADRLSNMLYDTVQDGLVYLVRMPEGKDAADMGEKLFKEYVFDNRVLYGKSVYHKILLYSMTDKQ